MSIRRKIALWICPELGAQRAHRSPVSPADLVLLAEAYAAHRGLTLSTVSTYAAGDGKFFGKLKGTSSCTLKTADSVVRWFSENWPADLEWPAHIDRPAPIKKEDAA